jgi:predicted secreted protein
MNIRPILRSVVAGILLCALGLVSAFAGDVATFVNLGFSSKSEYFMFGFHGWDANTKSFFAEIYTVQVKENRFAPNGVVKKEYPGQLGPGQDTAGAFYTLLEENGPLTKKFGINHLKQGRPIYILMNGEPPKDRLEFRDFVSSSAYKVKMVKDIKGKDEKVQSAFYLDVSLTLKDGKTRTHTIGLKDHYRAGIQDYRIRQILVSPDEQHVVFVIETIHYGKQGPSIRYMVETAKLF